MLFKMRHKKGQKVPRGHREVSKETWSSNLSEITRSSKHWATEISVSQGRPELQLSLFLKFNFKCTRYLRKWWNQNHCSLVDIRMRLSVHHHLMAPSKTSHKHLFSPSYLASTAAVSSNPCFSLLGCCPSTISLPILPQNSP